MPENIQNNQQKINTSPVGRVLVAEVDPPHRDDGGENRLPELSDEEKEEIKRNLETEKAREELEKLFPPTDEPDGKDGQSSKFKSSQNGSNSIVHKINSLWLAAKKMNGGTATKWQRDATIGFFGFLLGQEKDPVYAKVALSLTKFRKGHDGNLLVNGIKGGRKFINNPIVSTHIKKSGAAAIKNLAFSNKTISNFMGDAVSWFFTFIVLGGGAAILNFLTSPFNNLDRKGVTLPPSMQQKNSSDGQIASIDPKQKQLTPH